jgi:hypothetical protein
VIYAPAFDHGSGKFSFNQLGLDIQLFNYPKKISFSNNANNIRDTNQDNATNIILEENLPSPIRHDQLKKYLNEYYYLNEENKNSIKIEIDEKIVERKNILVADLSEWKCKDLNPGKVAIDPELGRILVSKERPPKSVYVDYYYGFSSKVGAGFYNREDTEEILVNKYPIVYEIFKESAIYDSVSKAISHWSKNFSYSDVIFEIHDSETYDESFEICIPKKDKARIIIRSAQNKNPVITGNIRIVGDGEGGEVMLDGLTMVSQNLVTKKDKIMTDENSQSIISVIRCGRVGMLILRYCTLVSKECDSILVYESNDNLNVLVDHCIINGSISMSRSKALLTIKDSIVDGNIIESFTNGKINYKRDVEHKMTIDCYQINRIINSTILGKVNAEVLQLASNTIFSDIVTIVNSDIGCIRYSFVPEKSRIPSTFQCQPKKSTITNQDEKEEQGDDEEEKVNRKGKDNGGKNIIIKPIFKSQTFGNAKYAQLDINTSKEILEGGDNGSEMGVFNHIHQFQRIKILKELLGKNYIRIGLDFGIFIVT